MTAFIHSGLIAKTTEICQRDKLVKITASVFSHSQSTWRYLLVKDRKRKKYLVLRELYERWISHTSEWILCEEIPTEGEKIVQRTKARHFEGRMRLGWSLSDKASNSVKRELPRRNLADFVFNYCIKLRMFALNELKYFFEFL